MREDDNATHSYSYSETEEAFAICSLVAIHSIILLVMFMYTPCVVQRAQPSPANINARSHRYNTRELQFPAVVHLLPSRYPFLLSDHALVLLQVESSLILQPSSVILDTRDLLSIVIRNRILRTARAWICTILLDSSIETLLFPRNLARPSFPHCPDPETAIADRWAHKPA